MQFEVIRKSHKKSIVIGTSIFIILVVVLIARFTFAKYELVKSIKIAEGTINYKVPDFKIMAMYVQKDNSDCTDDNCYNELDEGVRIPSSGYVINETKSYCTLDNQNKDMEARLYTNSDGEHIFKNLAKSDKCYLYFDKDPTAGDTILGNVTVNEGTPDFSKTAQTTCSSTINCETTNGVYKARDNDGDSYYFRGAVDNNYVKFANKWWRIIRINGDGTIRLIYDGTSAHANGEATSDSIAVTNVKWSHKNSYWVSSTDNAYIKDNMYVGLKYTSGEVHGLGTKSNALAQLETWYTNKLATYSDKLDINEGFCGDREPSTDRTTSNGSGGTGITTTYYGAYIRLTNRTRTPELTCENASDLYTVSTSTKENKSLTYPIGLITADEIAMAGGVSGFANQSYYLCNGQNYWTLSPSHFFDGYAHVFIVRTDGYLYYSSVGGTSGLRPVINLRSDTKFTFTGTGEKGSMNNPYIVQ